MSSKFLDPAIYKKGRKVTLAGVVAGKETAPLGDTTYTYPVVTVKQLHLWKRRPVYSYLVYGVSILVLGVIYGKPILRRAFRRPATALELGLGFLGIFMVASTAARSRPPFFTEAGSRVTSAPWPS